MYGLNIDPRNPVGDPSPVELRNLGVEIVRYTFKDSVADPLPDQEIIRFYRQQLKKLSQIGFETLMILNQETIAAETPPASAPEEEWEAFIRLFAGRAAEIAKALARWRPAFQIWQAPDRPDSASNQATALPEARFRRLLQQTSAAIKGVDARLTVVAGGLVSGQPEWLARVIEAEEGPLPVDAVAIHPYTKRPAPEWPDPAWGTGYVGDLLAAYRETTNLPLWITEIGVDSPDGEEQAEYLRRFYQTITAQFAESVEQVFWFCYSDGMVYPFGLVDITRRAKPAYRAYQAVAKAAPPPSGSIESRSLAQAAVSLDRLHLFAQYLEQHLAFGQRDRILHQQMENELRGNGQQLSRTDIWRIMNKMLTGSAFTIRPEEVDSLNALQAQKDLYGFLRAIVLTTHQKTGAFTGRIGPHVRISAESEPNAATNIKATAKVLRMVISGNRMIIMDLVKATADEAKLLAPDIFETNIYGQLRNGLIDNHAWNLQRLVRALRDQALQDQTLLILRLDGPDSGANVNVFNGDSIRKYELALAKLLRYVETMLPDTLFKIVLGNEPDLFHERPWSDPDIDAKTFTINQFAPAMGNFMKRLARQRVDVTFICPALSANLKRDQLAYYTAFFGQERLENLVPALHGYSNDIAALPGAAQNLVEQQAAILRQSGGFRYVTGTELGSTNPLGDGASLNEKGYLDEVVLWLLLSNSHLAPPGQDNNWSFFINPEDPNDVVAQRLATIINHSEQLVLRNIRDLGGGDLQIVRNHIGPRPAYSVDYVSHTTPAAMNPGETTTVTVTIRNTSYRTWSSRGANPIRLGYRWYTAAGPVVPGDMWPDYRTALPRDLLSGEAITLTAQLGAPIQPGIYEVRWDMVEEGITWFSWQGTPTLPVPVVVGDVEPPPAGLQVRASHNNNQQGPDNLRQAIDDDPATRWSSRALQQPGMWFEIDLGQTRTVKGLELGTAGSPQDYPRGYVVRLSTDSVQWTEAARDPDNDGPLDVTFAPRPARYIRIEQTGRADQWWWSIHEIVVNYAEDEPPPLTGRASHNNVLTGADNVAQAFDDRPETRWSSRALQQPGMWFEIDLGQTRTVKSLELDTAGSPQDYPRGYVVRLSTDRTQWEEVAREPDNDGPLDVTFIPRPARYIRVEQTGSSEQWWWSIHEVIVGYGENGTPPELTGRASHNNVQTGFDNVAQAFDDRPETRWSSQAVQQPGMWFEIDLGQTRTVNGLELNIAGSPQDYPRGYVVRLSTDQTQWEEVAREPDNDGPLDVIFTPRPARYIRVEQTGSSEQWWWSIHEVVVKEEEA